MSNVGNIMFWRGKRIDEMTHEECIACIKQMGARVQELESLPIDWRKYVFAQVNASMRPLS
jgi:hypothetical protein